MPKTITLEDGEWTDVIIALQHRFWALEESQATDFRPSEEQKAATERARQLFLKFHAVGK